MTKDMLQKDWRGLTQAAQSRFSSGSSLRLSCPPLATRPLEKEYEKLAQSLLELRKGELTFPLRMRPRLPALAEYMLHHALKDHCRDRGAGWD